jgi:hypothetical protein
MIIHLGNEHILYLHESLGLERSVILKGARDVGIKN